MALFDIFVALVFGLVVGSFLNVVIYRLPGTSEGEVLHKLSFPASHCSICKSHLKIWHNIPLLSYLLLKGRCGFCHTPISFQYPLVELANAILWMMSVGHWGMHPVAFLWAIFFSYLLTLSVIDIQTTNLPETLTQPLLWIGLIASSFGLIQISLEQAILGAVSGYFSLWFVANIFKRLTGRDAMGDGDFKLLAALGGWLGPLSLIQTFILASLSGALVGIWIRNTNHLKRYGHLTFGPFLAAAGIIQSVFPNYF